MLDAEESRRIGEALAAIRARLAKMRLDRDASLARLAEIRHAADAHAAERGEQRARHDRESAP